MLENGLSLCARVACFGCGDAGASLCDGCRMDLAPPSRDDAVPSVDRVLVPWAYKGAARDLVLALKLRHRRDAAEPLARAIAETVRAVGSPAEIVSWVPGRRRDVRIRGFDHAHVIAEQVASHLGLALVGLLRRTSARPDQTTLSGPERRANLIGAFSASPCSRSVLLVDDLVTTGATASACAQALKAAGAPGVDLGAPCRA